MKDTIKQTINGKIYSAEREVTGKRKVRQVITFMDHKEHDDMTYGPNDSGVMKTTAELILWQLVTKGWLGQPPLETLKVGHS